MQAAQLVLAWLVAFGLFGASALLFILAQR
jgi:hypothetical protein